MKQKFLTKAIMATLLGGMMFAPNLALAVNYNWDMQNMVKLGTSTSIVAKQATSGQSLNVYLNSTTGHYTLNAKMCSTNKFILYYGYDKETGEVLGNAIAPIQAKGSTTNKPQFVFTLKASDLPENYTAEQLDGIFKKLLEKYVDVYDTSNFFYNGCSLQVVDDSGNQLYEGKFNTVNKTPNYLAISGKTLNATNMQTIGSTSDQAFIVGTAADQNEIALGKSDVVVSSTTFKFPTVNTADETLYGIYNDQAGKILASGGKFTLNAGNNAAPDKSIGIYAGNISSMVGEVKLNFDDLVSITTGLHTLEAGKNGKITVSGAEAGGNVGMTLQTIKKGYAAYAHDGGEVNVIYGGTSNFHLNHTTANDMPDNGAILYAESGGTINADSQGSGNFRITVAGLAGSTGKAMTDSTGVINLKMSGNGGYLQVNADGNVNITLAGGTKWQGTAAGNTTLTAGNKSMWEYSSTEAQHLKSFTGTGSEGNNSFVTMAGGNITIDTYSGNGLFLFTNSSNTISGGNITVTSAIATAAGGEANPLLDNITKDTLYFDSANDGVKEISAGYENITSSSGTSNSVITLATTTTLTDNTEIKNLLTEMANKLVYTGIQNSETNLDAVVAVVDSLATNGNILRYANVTFNNDGSKVVGELQTPVAAGGLHVQIFGEEPSGSVYEAYVTKDAQQNNVYTFNKDIIINRYAKTQIDGKSQAEVNCQFWSPIFGAFKADENPATVSQSPWNAGELNYTVDMQNHKLTAKNHYETGRVQAIDRSAIINLNREGSIIFNNVAGMDLQATADMYYTSAVIVQEYSPNNALTKGAHITINNSAGWDNAVKATSYLSGGDAAYAMNNYIIFADGRNVPKDTATGMLSIDIANLVDVDATKGQFGVTAWGWGSEISVGGGKILSNGGMPAISTTGNAVVNFNVTKDTNGVVVGAGSNPVMIDGVVKTGTPFYGSGGTINIGLNTSDSYVKGTIIAEGEPNPNAQGYMAMGYGYTNIWMGNGAKWINTGVSKVTNLRADNKVNVLDMTTNGVGSVTIDNYSGNLVAIYKHNHDGDEASDYAAADITIKKAGKNSSITLATDNSGINMTDETIVNNALNILASKLIYSGYINGEKNLVGKVEILQGLTAASTSLKLGAITFDSATGKGGYGGLPTPESDPEPTPIVDPTPGTAISHTLTGTMSDQVFLGNKVSSVSGVTTYDFSDGVYSINSMNTAADSSAVINIGSNTLYFVGKTNKCFGITLNDGSNVTINGNVNTSSYSSSYSAAGIAMMIGGTGVGKKSTLTINGHVNMGDADNYGVVADDKHGAYSFYKGTRWTGAGINMNQGHGSKITITNGLSMYVDGHGIVTDPYYADKKYADKDLAVVNVNGDTNIHVQSSEDVGLYALANFGGTININMTNGNPGNDKVIVYGNAIVMKDTLGESENPYFYRSGRINLALTTKDSLWTGAVDNTGTNQAGEFNLYLKNGGTWKYQNASKMDGLSAATMPSPSLSYYGTYDGVSHVTNLTGGSSDATRGVIKVISSDTLAIKHYSGNNIVLYEHDETNPATIYGANIRIASADVASVITLSTDNVGVNGSNYLSVFNALAKKLYYTAGNENLIGKLQITEGLTSSAVALYTGNIVFGSNGQGSYTTEGSTTLVEHGIGGGDNTGLGTVTETADTTTFVMDGGKKVSVETGSALIASGKNINISTEDVLILESTDATKPVVDASTANVTVGGKLQILGQENQDLISVSGDKEVSLDAVELVASGTGKVIDMKAGSKVNLGVDSSGQAKGVDVKVTGDIQNTQGTLNLALATADSSWNGNYANDDAVLNLTIDNLNAKWTGSVNGAELNVNINKGTWVNTGASSSTSGKFNLTGGGAGQAFLDMSDTNSGNVTVDKFKGGITLVYAHDESTPTNVKGGNVTITSAEANSVVNMMTDGKGLDLTTEVGANVTNDNNIKAALNALAAKLTYTNFASEGNITGIVGIGESLTRPTITSKIADLKFDTAQGSIDENTFDDNVPHGEIVYGDSETAMMRGAKMAMASTAMIWRAENNDLMKRMGDLRLRTEDSGVWAKYYSGKNEYDNNGSFNNKYKAVQVGVDTKLGNGWLGGVAFSYDNGRSNYSNGGNGDNKVKSLAAYATKLSKDGQYVDLIAKVSHLSNEYTVYNDYGYSLNGDYKNFGMSLSAEYGKKFDLKDGFYITPAAELTVGRINSKSYDAYSAYYNKNLHVEQDAFNSAVGRLSVAVGKKSDRATYYAKVGLAHEFAGGFDTTYSAPNEPTSSTSINFKDTWMELQLGGSVKLKNDATIYGTFGKTLGGEVKEKWRVDVGMLFTFNHISEFFGGKKKAQGGAVAAAAPAANLTEGAAPVEEKVYTTETAAVADAKGERSASVKVGDTEVGATMPAPKVSKGAFMLDEYVVTANRTKQRITDATADISVVTRKEIEEMHMETVEEALRTVPGVQFNNYGGGNQINANISGLRINGSKDIAILVDGVKINAFQGVDASGYMYSSVLNNMNNIERIEVLRGAAGVLYGSNAKGGVINIITREVEENKTILDGSIGSFSRRDYKINTMGKVGKMSYNLYQGTFHQGDVTDGNGDKWEGFTDTVNFGGKFAYKFDDKSKLTLDYSKIKSNFGGTDLIYNNFYNGKYDSEMLSVRHDWTIDKHWDNTFVYRKTDEKRLHKQEYFVGNVLKNTDTDYTYQFITDQVHFKNKYNDLVFGFEYTKAEDNITSGAKSDYTAHDIKNRAFFINEDLKIMKGVTLSGGIRNEKPDGFDLGSYTTKSYKLAWDPTKKDTIYAGRSEFFILPSMDQLFNKSWGNADLKPAQGRTESIGYNRKFDQNNFMTVNWFQTKEDTGYGYDDTKGKYVNTENGISRGWNAQYTCKLSDKWNFNLGWTHLYTHASGYDSYSFGYYPKDYATFGFNYECGKFSGGLNGFYYFRAKDEQNRRIFPADNYGVFNLSFNYKPTKGFKTYLKIDNIFNKFYAEHTDAGNDPFLTGTGSRKFYAMPGRAFMVGMEFTF